MIHYHIGWMLVLSAFTVSAQVDSTMSMNIVPYVGSRYVDHRDRGCDETTGTVVVGFEVDSLCRISKKHIIDGLGEACDKAALRMVDNSYEAAVMRANGYNCRPGLMRMAIKMNVPR